MLRTTADQLNLSSRTRSVVERCYPDEQVLFTTAVTILETDQTSPIGWSLRRFAQRRGNVVITDKRLFVQSSFLSLFSIFWLGIIAYSIYEYSHTGHFFHIAIGIPAAIFIVQRRPYSRDLPFDAIRCVEFGTTRGIAARCDIMSIVLADRAIQLVTAQIVPSNLRDKLLVLGNDDQAIDSKGTA